MFEPLMLAVAIAAATSPSPAQTTPPTPLREIGRVRASAACTAIVVRANSAIGATLRNDQTLSMTIGTLRKVDLDGNLFERTKGLHSLEKLGTDLRMSAAAAEGQITKLRELAAESTDEQRKNDLKSFADALGGALFRQKRIGMDVQRMVLIIEGRTSRAEAVESVARAAPETRSACTGQQRL